MPRPKKNRLETISDVDRKIVEVISRMELPISSKRHLSQNLGHEMLYGLRALLASKTNVLTDKLEKAVAAMEQLQQKPTTSPAAPKPQGE